MNTLRRLVPQSHIERRGGILQGCLIVLAIIVILVGVVLFWVYLNWRSWTANALVQVTTMSVQEFDLPPDQQQAIIAEVELVAQDFKDKKISPQDMVRIMEEVGESPLFPIAGVIAAQNKYIEPSTLPAEEKAAAVRSLQRFARGVHEKQIPREAIEDVIKPIVTIDVDGGWEFKESATDEEVRQFAANAKARADAVSIPDEAYEIDIAVELRKAIDKGLGRTGS